MRNSVLIVINGVIITLLILLWIFMPAPLPSPAAPSEVPEVHNATKCALKKGDIRHCGNRSYIVDRVYWDEAVGWIADETLLNKL